MNNIKFKNQSQFLYDFSNELRNTLNKNYYIENNKKLGKKDLDIFIKNSLTGSSFIIEIKGNPNDNTLPPEIIPWLQNVKNNINDPKNHFIIFSLSGISENVKTIFNQNKFEIFEYPKHKTNLTNDFISFIESLDN